MTVFLLLLACRASALNPALDVSQYAHSSWKISEGVSNGTIHEFAQTRDGYVWLATEAGLRRFDGVNSALWQPPQGERLPSNDIRGLLAARDGTLWLGTAKGLASFRGGKLIHYPQLDGFDVNTLREDHEGTVWVAAVKWERAFSEPGRFCAIKAGAVQCLGADGAFGFGVSAIHEDSSGNLWLGAANGIWRWKPGPPQRYTLRPELPGPIIFSRNTIIDRDGAGLIIGAFGGIMQFVDGKTEPYTLPSTPPTLSNTTLLRDHEGSLWISSTDAGLAHVHHGRMDLYTQNDGLTSNSVEALFEDREGSIWAATNLGIDRFREYPVATISTKQGLSSSNVLCVLAARDGSIWLGTTDGLDRWKDGHITIFRRPAAPPTQNHKPPADGPEPRRPSRRKDKVREVTSGDLTDNFIATLFQDSRGRIWIGTGTGLTRFENGSLSRVAGLPFSPQNPLVEDSSGNLWTAQNDRGLVRLEEGKLVEEIPWARLGIEGALANPLAADLANGGVWVGSWSGGVVYFRDGQVRASYRTHEGLGGGRVNSLQFDTSGRLWAATDGGLSCILKDRAITLSSTNGLPCDIAQDILEDDTHALWVHMGCGLVRVTKGELDSWGANPARKVQSTVYDAFDGVISHAGVYNFGPRAAKTTDGKLWFSRWMGVMVVDPHHLPLNPLAAPVRVEQIKADGKTLWDNLSFPAAANIRVPPGTRRLEIGYAGLSLVAPEKVRFKYKLEGYDGDWQDAGNRRQAFYNDVRPRDYRFRVMACNNSGVWNETGDSLEFSIAPAYYQTTWFLALSVAVFLALLWGIHRLRVYQIAREFSANLDGRVDERLRVARDLHDTLLQTVQASLIQMQAAYNLFSRRPEKAIETLQRAITASEAAISEGREAIQNMRASTVIKNDLALALRLTGDQMAAAGSATFDVRVQGPSRDLHPILRDEVYRITLEAIRNAFQHAEAHAIEAEILYGDSLRVRIRDDGKGIVPAIMEEGRSGHYGLAGMRERAERIGGKLDVWTSPGAGTEIQLNIPGTIAFGRSGPRTIVGRFRRRVTARLRHKADAPN